jgi:hypothetical protein
MSGMEIGILGVHRWGAIFKPEGRKYGRNAFDSFRYTTQNQKEKINTKKKCALNTA